MKCAVCGEHAEKQCAQCHVLCYCERKCQREDWTTHRAACLAFKTNVLNWLQTQKCNNVLVLASTDANERKKIHQCVERATTSFSRSLKLTKLPYGEVKLRLFKKCMQCGAKNIRFGSNDYREGVMNNNQDESYEITCPQCNHNWDWECNYDDCDAVRYIFGNNSVAIGNTMKYFRHTYAVKSKLNADSCPQLPDVSCYKQKFVVPVPADLRGIKNLQKLLNGD